MSVKILFQFHNGSIKETGDTEKGEPEGVSIPQWFD